MLIRLLNILRQQEHLPLDSVKSFYERLAADVPSLKDFAEEILERNWEKGKRN